MRLSTEPSMAVFLYFGVCYCKNTFDLKNHYNCHDSSNSQYTAPCFYTDRGACQHERTVLSGPAKYAEEPKWYARSKESDAFTGLPFWFLMVFPPLYARMMAFSLKPSISSGICLCCTIPSEILQVSLIPTYPSATYYRFLAIARKR